MYTVIRAFKDKTNGHIYLVGDTFPHKGRKPKQERLDELLNGGFIELVESKNE